MSGLKKLGKKIASGLSGAGGDKKRKPPLHSNASSNAPTPSRARRSNEQMDLEDDIREFDVGLEHELYSGPSADGYNSSPPIPLSSQSVTMQPPSQKSKFYFLIT